MPRTRSLAWSELKIGLLTTVGIVITAIAIFMLTGGRGFPWQRYQLKTTFPNVAGLSAGSPVRVAGIEVGSVTGLAFAGEQVDITMEINAAYRDRITTEASAVLGSVSLLGESAVDITPSSRGVPIEEGGYVPAGRSRGQISDVAEQASIGLEQVTALVQDMRDGRGTVGRLMTDDRLYEELRRVAATTGDLTERLRDGQGSIGRLLNDPAMAEALEASLANLQGLTARIDAGEGSIGRLLADDSFAESLSAATANLEVLTGRLNRGEGTIGQLLADDTLITRLNEVTEQLRQVTGRLNRGEGTAGQLLKDERLYENMNGAVSDLRQLVADIRADPRKFLTLRMSIF